MTDAPRSCRATTKAGAPCKNVAQAGGDFCLILVHMAQAAPRPAAARLADDPEFTKLVGELNQLADEMRGQTRSPEPPPFSHERLLGLVRSNFERVAALFGLEAATQLLDSLQGASPKDALDPDTWKGLYYILNALVNGAEQVGPHQHPEAAQRHPRLCPAFGHRGRSARGHGQRSGGPGHLEGALLHPGRHRPGPKPGI